MENKLHAVTGAYGYTGKYIARQLLAAGHQVRTLTNTRPAKDPFGGSVETHPLAFAEPENLVSALRGVQVLYNTYWVRFNHSDFSHAEAVNNTRVLFAAAARAGVERIVHVSITNPSLTSPFEYFRGKAELENCLRESGLSYAILRPAVFFGGEDILINNIAWMLRHFPLYGVFGDGNYGIQPIHIEDFARLAVAAGGEKEDGVINATGPESFTFGGLVEQLGRIIDCPRPIIPIPPWFGLLAGRLVGMFVRDVVITREEIGGLMAGLLAVDEEARGLVRLTDWAREHRDTLGRRYASELARRSSE
ncbi:MAG: epimerase [Desulfuromonas sp.]|nr:MAG: epimerase [Desulfuromonas sp.]